jgi:lipopolysaccharide transport system ATP-binding protein
MILLRKFMSGERVITVSQVSKEYSIYSKPHHRLLSLLGRANLKDERYFCALKDVSFEIFRGETVGIIGRNGSGKSTLLQIICGTLSPTRGSVCVRGRVGALLELGSGFNPEFTGRENVFLNATLLGLSQDEILAKYDDIVAFADIGEFIDQPIKTYSSGMIVRLAFAVQAQLSPDILIIDEALAVGDARFQQKCFARLKQLKEQGTSILLVTHSTEQIVTHCSRAILLDSGAIIESGEPRKVVNRYLDLLFGQSDIPPEHKNKLDKNKSSESSTGPLLSLSQSKDVFSEHPSYNPNEYRWGDGRVQIIDYHLESGGSLFPSVVETGSRIRLSLAIFFQSHIVAPVVGITIKTKEGVTVYGTNSDLAGARDIRGIGKAGTVLQIDAEFLCQLAAGDYFISVGVASRDGENVIPHDRRYDSIHLKVVSSREFYGLVDLSVKMSMVEGR